MLVSFYVNLMYTLINVRCTRAENVGTSYSDIQIFDNLFHNKNTVTVQWIKRLKGRDSVPPSPPGREIITCMRWSVGGA